MDIPPRAAEPSLATSFLSPDSTEPDESSDDDEYHEWRLGPDMYSTGLLSTGQVTGISSLIPRVDYGSLTGESSRVRQWVDELSVRFLLSFISQASPGLSQPKAIVLHCSGIPQLHQPDIHRLIQAKVRDLPPEEARLVLDSVKILQVTEFDQILAQVGRISDMLFKAEQQRHNMPNLKTATNNSSRPPSESEKSNLQSPTLLLIEGIDLILQEALRMSPDADAARAQLSAFLRTVGVLCRTYHSLLAVAIVTSIPVRPQPPLSVQLSVEELQAHERAGIPLVETPSTTPYRIEDMTICVDSAFETPSDKRWIKPSSHLTSQYLLYLAETMSEGLDLHLVVSERESHRVVEVVKDRVGNRLGRWDLF